ncbi:MAG: hypothetical protein MUP11_08345, partial [Anaerolineales bacterium]|nr:hypothetical protein [Anaerolineales bacterium]
MDNVRDSFKKGFNSPPIMAAVGIVVGIILGLLYGWVISPVKFVDGNIEQLRDDLKVDFLRMAIDSYALNQDAALADERYNQLGDSASTYLSDIEFNPTGQLISDIDSFRDVVEMTLFTDVMEDMAPVEKKSDNNLLKWALLITIVLAGALVVRYFLARRAGGGGVAPKTAATMAHDVTAKIDSTDYNGKGDAPPMHQFVTTYVLGDNLFDDSFSIESAAGEFLGECGVGISEAIGVGE